MRKITEQELKVIVAGVCGSKLVVDAGTTCVGNCNGASGNIYCMVITVFKYAGIPLSIFYSFTGQIVYGVHQGCKMIGDGFNRLLSTAATGDEKETE